MHLIVIHKKSDLSADQNSPLLRSATSNPLISDMTFEALAASCHFQNNGDKIFALPDGWNTQTSYNHVKITRYNGTLPTPLRHETKTKPDSRFIISNGRFAATADQQLLRGILTGFDADIITVNIDPALQSYRERIRVTTTGEIAGFHRLYSDSILPTSLPDRWPHHLFIKNQLLDKILINDALPLSFTDFIERCKSHSLSFHCLKIAGTLLDLETEAGLCSLLTTKLNSTRQHSNHLNAHNGTKKNNHMISPTARLFGKVLLGNNVQIGENAIIVGPTIIADNVTIAPSAVIRASVIGSNIRIPESHILKDRILLCSHSQCRTILNTQNNKRLHPKTASPCIAFPNGFKYHNFRLWPWFSYPHCLKRLIDIIISLMVLTLFIPLFPLIVLAIKLSSPGPIFFKHKREGLHGKQFSCLKFRTMIIGADSMQEQLRSKNQVDGPQFKVKDDPRVTLIGKFLRDTFIDEIPQFINILLGQMSVVGPRPSPKTENSLCPFWRDARLSVRPGITGLWQIRRTRRKGRDFQEWIHYDVKYVRDISLTLDLLTCWQTIEKVFINFIHQLRKMRQT